MICFQNCNLAPKETAVNSEACLRKLLGIAENAPIIRSNLRKYKLKSKTKNKGKLFVHEKALIKMLRINKRVMRLLIEKELIQCLNISGLNIYTVADIEHFLKNNNSITIPR